jgi:hypothetical protein
MDVPRASRLWLECHDVSPCLSQRTADSELRRENLLARAQPWMGNPSSLSLHLGFASQRKTVCDAISLSL